MLAIDHIVVIKTISAIIINIVILAKYSHIAVLLASELLLNNHIIRYLTFLSPHHSSILSYNVCYLGITLNF